MKDKLPAIKKLTKQENETIEPAKYIYSKEKERWSFLISGEHADKIRRIMFHNNFPTQTAVLDYILKKYLDPIDLPPVPQRKDF